MRALNSNKNIDNSDLPNYPGGRIKDNTGSGNGTGVNEKVYGDLHQAIAKLMRLYGISPTGLPDNETNGFQIIEAFKSLASKNDYIYPLTTSGTVLSVGIKIAYMEVNEFVICLAGADKTDETRISGIGAGDFSVTYSGSFKANEYVRVVKTAAGVSIIRIAEWNAIEQMIANALTVKASNETVAKLLDRIVALEGRSVTNIPSGLIAIWGRSFSEIPEGWTEYTLLRGRVAIGVDVNDIAFNAVEKYSGSKTKTLSIAEMPSHSHKAFGGGDFGVIADRADAGGSSSNSEVATNNHHPTTAVTGGGADFSIMNPYRVVYYIQKT